MPAAITCMPAALDQTVAAEDLAELWELDRRTVYRYAADEGMPRLRRGEYPLRACTQWFIRRLKTEAEMRATGASSSELDAERIRLTRAQADRAEQDNEVARGKLLDSELVAQTLAQVAVICATEIDAIAPRVAIPLSGMADPAAITLYLRDECAAVRSSIARSLDDLSAIVARGDDSEAATET